MTSHLSITSADGTKIAADRFGDGPPVVLLHGGGQTRGSWRRTAGQLAERGYQAVTFDLRGHGDSDWSKSGYRIELFAEDLRAVVATLDRPAPAIIGASLGGLTALWALGSHDPVPASALVLVDIAARTNPKGTRAILAFMQAHTEGFGSIDEAADAVARYMTDRPRPRNVEGLRRNLRERDGRLYWHWDPRLLDDRSDAESERRWGQQQIETAAHNITMPALLIRGEHSEVIDGDSIAHMRAIMPQIEVFEVEGAGHMVAGDANSPFAAAIIGFLSHVYPA